MHAASEGKSVIIIQFLKGKGIRDTEFIKRLEPEIKFFKFEKSDENFSDLSEERKKEEIQNIKNGVNFAKKVLATNGCDLLILDEILGLIDVGVITVEDLKVILASKQEETTLIMTGIQLSDEICVLADEVSRIEKVNFKVY